MKKAEKLIAYDLYMRFPELPGNELAKRAGVSYKTFAGWRDSEGWEKVRAAKTITKHTLKEAAYKQLAEINTHVAEVLGGLLSKELADAKGVIIKELALYDDNPLPKIIEILEDFATWACQERIKFSDYAGQEDHLALLDIVNHYIKKKGREV